MLAFEEHYVNTSIKYEKEVLDKEHIPIIIDMQLSKNISLDIDDHKTRDDDIEKASILIFFKNYKDGSSIGNGIELK